MAEGGRRNTTTGDSVDVGCLVGYMFGFVIVQTLLVRAIFV